MKGKHTFYVVICNDSINMECNAYTTSELIAHQYANFYKNTNWEYIYVVENVTTEELFKNVEDVLNIELTDENSIITINIPNTNICYYVNNYILTAIHENMMYNDSLHSIYYNLARVYHALEIMRGYFKKDELDDIFKVINICFNIYLPLIIYVDYGCSDEENKPALIKIIEDAYSLPKYTEFCELICEDYLYYYELIQSF